ncbi:hypothetical protein EGW08_008108 [Elysia chlorotica]|uniref:CTCK domain-containing protein n=1 Tax=Elysia chlorotica TaxID=188477 RepID=A0A433TRE6_ELYCH|nr:hypothetical protein EGW08_008108 [Elysia chlorotica]
MSQFKLTHLTYLTYLLYILMAALLSCCDGSGGAVGGAQAACAEPANLMDLYRDLREQQIAASSIMEEPSTAAYTSAQGSSSRSSSSNRTITKLAGHHHNNAQSSAFSGICRCQATDELNHDPTRIPRIIPQSSCRPHRPWRTLVYSAECEEVYTPVKIKRRTGCLNGVYQYSDAWESVAIGCKCQVYRRIVVTRN